MSDGRRSLRFPLLALPLLLFLLLPSSLLAGASEEEKGPLFTFVILADPHICGPKEHATRLADCVTWINANREERHIELVLVVGDIAWGDGQLEEAKRLLDELQVPYVPLIGDNEVETGYDEHFHTVFRKQYAHLKKRLTGWRKTRTPVKHPKAGRKVYLQNFSFDHRGVHFVALDWCTRTGGETADLNDYPGGTWPWFTKDVKRAAKGTHNRIVMLTHLPMHVNFFYEVFSKEEQAAVDEFLHPFADFVYADFAGHYHFNWLGRNARGGYDFFVTDATWDDKNTIRLVEVRKNEEENAFVYKHGMIHVPVANPPEDAAAKAD